MDGDFAPKENRSKKLGECMITAETDVRPYTALISVMDIKMSNTSAVDACFPISL